MVLVTGAAGHLGNALVRELLAVGEEVRAFVLPGEDISSLGGMPLEVFRGDVLDCDALASAMVGVSAVFHLAGIISIMPGRSEAMRTVNVVGTANVARLARKARVGRMVYVSSIHALARPAHGMVIDESVPFDPHSAAGEYDQTKAEASLAVLSEVSRGLDAVIICPTGIIGPWHSGGGSPMNAQLRRWTRPGWHMVVDGQFDFVDVRDVARGMVLAARSGRRGETYIINGERISVARLFALVQEACGGKGKAVRVPLALARFAATFAPLHARIWKTTVSFTRYALETLVSNSHISAAKARQQLGYLPRQLAETVGDTVRWIGENPARVRARRRLVTPVAARPRAARRSGLAVVTGASSGIGSAVSRRLAGLGYRVLLVARRADRLEALAERIAQSGGRAEPVPADLSSPEGVRDVFERVRETGEGLDVLVNNAGFGWYGYTSDMSPQTARAMVQVNNESLAELVVRFLPGMRARGRGHIINVSSIVGGFPSPWAALYSATKSFIDGLSTALFRELRGTGVSVSAVRPGPVLTEFYQTVSRLSEGRSIPVRNIRTGPEDVAEQIVRLLRRPRRVLYVPRRFSVLPWVELAFGWLYDLVAGILLRRQAQQV